MHLSFKFWITAKAQKRQRDLVNQHVLNVGIFAKEEKLSIFFLRWYLSFTQKVFKLLH